jgi:hypothetical protein
MTFTTKMKEGKGKIHVARKLIMQYEVFINIINTSSEMIFQSLNIDCECVDVLETFYFLHAIHSF